MGGVIFLSLCSGKKISQQFGVSGFRVATLNSFSPIFNQAEARSAHGSVLRSPFMFCVLACIFQCRLSVQQYFTYWVVGLGPVIFLEVDCHSFWDLRFSIRAS